MTRHQRMAAKAKVVQKIDPERQREAEELRRVIGISRTLVIGGALVGLVGCLLGTATESDVLTWVLALPGLVAAVAGYVINLRRAKCPGCKGFLGTLPSVAHSLPKSCPHCGRKW